MDSIDAWVIYDKPINYSDKVVARRFKNELPTNEIHTFPTIDDAHRFFDFYGFSFLTRNDNDDPVIVGTYL